MGIRGNTWLYMVIHGNAWLYKIIHGNTWHHMVVVFAQANAYKSHKFPTPWPPVPDFQKKKNKKILHLLCCLRTRNCESSPVFLGIRNSESTRVLFGRSAILDALLCFCKEWHLLMNCRLCSLRIKKSGAPNENIAQNHLNIALLNVF